MLANESHVGCDWSEGWRQRRRLHNSSELTDNLSFHKKWVMSEWRKEERSIRGNEGGRRRGEME